MNQFSKRRICWYGSLQLHLFPKQFWSSCQIPSSPKGYFLKLLHVGWLATSIAVKTLRPIQNGRHFADDIFQCVSLNGNVYISIEISLKSVPKGPMNNITSLVHIMAWCRPVEKPLSEQKIISLLYSASQNTLYHKDVNHLAEIISGYGNLVTVISQHCPSSHLLKVQKDAHGPVARYAKLWVAHAPGMPGTFSPPPRVSDPDMHHGTCVTHVSWCKPGSLTSGFLWNRWRGKRSQHSRRMRNLQVHVPGKRPIGCTGIHAEVWAFSMCHSWRMAREISWQKIVTAVVLLCRDATVLVMRKLKV